jgi:hypothetical protein
MIELIMQVDNHFREPKVPLNVWRAFQALGLDFATRREPYRLLFDGDKPRGSAGVPELWSVHFSMDQLSNRRRAARVGWINKGE